MTDSGTLVWQAIYSPFGKAERVTGSVQNNLRFPGQFFDAETGLHYNWHRFYDPETGRYVSADPIGLDGGDEFFAYVLNDPVNWIDRLGLYLYGEPGSLGSEWPKIPHQKPPWYNDLNHGLAQRFDPANPKPIRGPFGTLCGAEGTAMATWIPDLIPGACKRHDDCYDKCTKNCEGYNCKTKCDFELMSSSIIYGGATYFIGKDAYDDDKHKYNCPCE